MSFRLSCRRFLIFVRERSGLRDRMKNKKIRCESRKGIQVKQKIYLPLKLIYRTYLKKTHRRVRFSQMAVGLGRHQSHSHPALPVLSLWRIAAFRPKRSVDSQFPALPPKQPALGSPAPALFRGTATLSSLLRSARHHCQRHRCASHHHGHLVAVHLENPLSPLKPKLSVPLSKSCCR